MTENILVVVASVIVAIPVYAGVIRPAVSDIAYLAGRAWTLGKLKGMDQHVKRITKGE